MITEDYVSFETAKLLKEKGFDENTPVNYFVGDDKPRGCMVGEMIYHKRLEEDTHLIACPTLQMAMKWLREVHHLFIGCEPRLSFTDFYWITANIYRVRKKSSLYHTEDVDDYHCVASCDSHSYEKACEAAIRYCLENLI